MDQMTSITVGEFSDYWLNAIIKSNIRQTTYATYKGFIENHIKKRFEKTKLAELSPVEIRHFSIELGAEGNKLSPKTVHLIMVMFKNILSCALEFGYVCQNPFDKIRMPRYIDKEARVFDRIEQQSIEKAINRSADRRGLGILICLYTGIRLGELCALKWTDIDIKNKTLQIKSSLKRVYNYNDGGQSARKTSLIEEEPKTKKSRRTIPLPDFICEALKKSKESSASGYVISMKDGRYVKPRTMQLYYSKLLKQADVPYGNFHTLRHTFASRAIELLADVKTVSEILGHTNSMITLNRYAHSFLEEKHKLMSSFNRFFNGKDKK